MTITYYPEVVQGSEEWAALRCGRLTASEMKLILTPTLKIASNDKERSHLFELLAQRVTGYVEPAYVSSDMLRGVEDEFEAKKLYSEKYAATTDVGFVTNDSWGFDVGYSPDAVIGDDGLIECKSRRMKFHVQTIIEGVVPDEFMLQTQTGLFVTDRKWCDFVSWCGGLPMYVKRVFPDPTIQQAIRLAATQFEERLEDRMRDYKLSSAGLIPTERKIVQEMYV